MLVSISTCLIFLRGPELTHWNSKLTQATDYYSWLQCASSHFSSEEQVKLSVYPQLLHWGSAHCQVLGYLRLRPRGCAHNYN